MAWFLCLILVWPNFRASWVGHKRSFGTKTHIFEKYHFQLKIPIRNMFNLFLKKLSGNIFPWLSPFIFQAPVVASAIPPWKFSSLRSLVVGSYLKVSYVDVPQENLEHYISVDVVPNTAISTAFFTDEYFFLELNFKFAI